jgi:hypothetical protein
MTSGRRRRDGAIAAPCRPRAAVLGSRLVSRASAMTTTTVTPITRPRTRPVATTRLG